MSDATIQASPEELAERLQKELELTTHRAVIAVVIASPGLERAAEQARERAMKARGLAKGQVVCWEARHDGAADEQLLAINRGRDVLLREKRLVWLRMQSAVDVRLLRRTAPDLVSAVDLFLELRPETEAAADWPRCREQLRAHMEERHRMLDLTGLLPATVDKHELPLEALYQVLVEPRPAGLGIEHGTTALLVLGHPGTGKTTFVRHLAWTYATQGHDPLDIGPKVPLLLSLSDYGYDREQDRVRSLVDFLPSWLAQQGIEDGDALVEHLPEVLLLLDGLDEMRAPEARRAVLAEVSQLVREHRVGGVVVTGRSFLVDELRQHDHVLQLTATQEPSEAQIQSFLTAFVRLRRGRRGSANDLVLRIEHDPDLRALARTPLMLAFMAILDELEGRLPDRRIEIYYRLGEMLVDRWTRARSIGTTARRQERPTRADALRVLGPLAWATVDRGGGAIPEPELTLELERIEGKRETLEEAKKRATALLDLLRSDTALLVPQRSARWGTRWAFVHSSIGEYFAGVEVERDKQRWSALLDDPFRPEWREIVLFCAGQLGVIEGRTDSLDLLVRAVLGKARRKGRYDAKYPSLLIGLLEEAPGLSRRQIDDVVKRLFELVMLAAYSPTAAAQMQRELVPLLVKAHGPVLDSLKIQLQGWFSRDFDKIRWDRLLTAARDRSEPARLERHFGRMPTASVANVLILGPFLRSLPMVKDAMELDLRPTFERWQREPDWRYRFAEWWASSSGAARQRPLAEIFRELELE